MNNTTNIKENVPLAAAAAAAIVTRRTRALAVGCRRFADFLAYFIVSVLARNNKVQVWGRRVCRAVLVSRTHTFHVFASTTIL
ncbi:hypothetical protein AWZ03_007353 [Drosophila navojoa]|uniref:Uncharacterized protein n=1 Tax=Drosophila navojoa TaxID=7232 RepID=A0A484BBQ3_DRONA|nr:hypothetical protein AWZ03_007353 [Drosophila navojoa]